MARRNTVPFRTNVAALKDSTLIQDHVTRLSAEDVILLLPWHSAGTLLPPLARKIERSLGSDAAMQRAFAAIERERDGISALNESLGRPSPRVLASLFAGIDAAMATDTISA